MRWTSQLRPLAWALRKNCIDVPRYLASKSVRQVFKGREIRISLHYGLANRLAALVGAWIEAEDQGVRLKMNWIRNDACGCDWLDLFEHDIPRVEGRCGRTDIMTDPSAICPSRATGVPLAWVKDWRLAECWTVPFFGNGVDERVERWHGCLQRLRPVRAVLDGILEFPPGRRVVGVHVRRGDLVLQHLSPDEWFREQLDSLAADWDVAFVLCSDDERVKQVFRQRYGSRLLTYESRGSGNDASVDRQTAPGVQQALRDLLTLSRTEKILGTYNSSFSWLASMWGKVPLELPSPRCASLETGRES